jgi:nicotinamide riboside kinase
MNNIKIAISGCHSQGKTTLLDRLARDTYLAEKNFRFGASTVRDLQKMGINISEAGDDTTQGLVVAKHIENAYREGNWILDRCILDSVAYGLVAANSRKIEHCTYEYNTLIGQRLKKKYNLMFYIMPELPLVNDGTRSLDQEYFEQACKAFEHGITTLDLKVIRLSGSVELRYNTVIEHIKKLFIQ